MPGATITTISALLKDLYLPPVVEQLNNEVLLLQRLEARSQEVIQGKQAIVPVHTGRSGGIGARPESTLLPDPGNQVYDKAIYDLKYLYGRVRVSGPGMARTQNDAGAFLQLLRSELDGIRNDLKRDLARQVYGDGTAIVTTLAVNTAVNTLTLGTASGTIPGGQETVDKGQLYVGMVVDIGTAANPVSVATGRTITAVNPATPSITIDGAAVTTATTDRIFRSGAAGASSASYEISGLQQIVSTATNTFGGINGATATYWDNLRDTTGGALSLDLLMKGYNRVRRAGGEVSSMITTFGLQRSFFNLLQSQVRYTEPLKIKGGFETLEFMGQPLIADLDAPYGKIFFLDEKFLKVFNTKDWHFLDEDGNVLKWRSGYDEWEAVLARYMNLGATRRNVQLVMSGLTDATGY